MTLKEARESRDWIRKDFAKLIGVTQTTIYNWETHIRPVSDAMKLKIAKVLVYSVSDIKWEA